MGCAPLTVQHAGSGQLAAQQPILCLHKAAELQLAQPRRACSSGSSMHGKHPGSAHNSPALTRPGAPTAPCPCYTLPHMHQNRRLISPTAGMSPASGAKSSAVFSTLLDPKLSSVSQPMY